MRGFTLIELVAVMLIFITVSTTITAILFSSLRGASKTNTLTSARENGQYAINQIVRTVRYAKNFQGVAINASSPLITNCTVVTPGQTTPTPTPARYTIVRVTDFNQVQHLFSCNSATDVPANTLSYSTITNATPTAPTSLLDTTAVSLVPNSCYFSCTQLSITDSPSITINFTLTNPVSSRAPLVENTFSAIPFQTTVTLRNLFR